MATVEAIPEGAEGSVLEATQQDFLQEAESLIAQHYKRINENKPQVTSINVFKNKHQKPKTGRFIPFEIKKSEILDIVQEHRMVLRSINYPKETSKCPPSEEDSEQISSSKPHVLNLKEKYQPEDPLQKAEKMLYDWRSFAWRRSSHPPHESIQSLAGSSGIFKDYYMKSYKKKELPTKPDQKPSKRAKAVPKSDKLDSKVKRIGPHIEIYQLFQERNKLIFTKRIVKLITITQAFIRGWLERKRLQRLKTKALYHGPNLKAVIMMYQFLIYRIRHRLGLWRTRQIINFGELEEWMDRKKFYETMFAKREDWQGLERSELMKYFNDCGHFPTQSQIDEYWDLFHRHSQGKYSEVIKKSNAIELLFTLYPPLGAKVNIGTRLRSTWLRPIVDGEEGYKYIDQNLHHQPPALEHLIHTGTHIIGSSVSEIIKYGFNNWLFWTFSPQK